MEIFPFGSVFSTLQMDIFGPHPTSITRKKYLICFVCPFSKWVETVPTLSITAKQVAKPFLEVTSHIGIPNMLLCDQALMFTGELKLSLGKNLITPVELLKAQWEGALPNISVPVAKYVHELHQKLKVISEIIEKILQKAHQIQKHYYDAKSHHREFKVGDSVLVLNPIKHKKLQVHWLGPGVTEQKLGNVNYVVRRSNYEKKPQVYHVNRLKPYVHRKAHMMKVKAASPERVVGEHVKQIEQELQEMLDLDIIQPSTSPWASPIVIVPKKSPDGQIQLKVITCHQKLIWHPHLKPLKNY
ncbi:hypothetical protein JRQ81_015320 [Phrynocephalus forsythii]|uniref:Integrase catalytic domain-containing protein n=1 Tax=Phrynocephalus forsythii TaxID=171643 RepID=A0A9Q0XX15_9SAUR|nr:hypothetical protein JRQ81_015320 [Phrynocephalus forsythii]